MSLQVYCRNAEALGGSVAGLLGTALFTVNPVAPFAFSTAFACGSVKPQWGDLQKMPLQNVQSQVWLRCRSL